MKIISSLCGTQRSLRLYVVTESLNSETQSSQRKRKGFILSIIYSLSSILYHQSSIIYHQSFIINHLSSIINH